VRSSPLSSRVGLGRPVSIVQLTVASAILQVIYGTLH